MKTLHLWLEQVEGVGKSLDPGQKKEELIWSRRINEVVKEWPY